VTTEDDFQRALDALPEDWQTRLVFADWLQEQGDPRAEGYRALGFLRLWPTFDAREPRWLYHNGTSEVMDSWPEYARTHNLLPRDWHEAVVSEERIGNWTIWCGYEPSRRKSEDKIALAFTRLPASRRAELLAGPRDRV
jgi:uncharacterized protein (TIGR02996 family)